MIDLSKFTLAEIRELKLQLARIKLPPETYLPPKEHKTKWYPACKEWDFTKSDTDIARVVGVEIGVVRYWRRKFGHPFVPRIYSHRASKQKLPKADWSAVDWNKPDIEIAREINMTRERVRQVRARLQKPKALAPDVKFARFSKAFEGCKLLKWKEARLRFKCSYPTFIDYCIRCGIEVDVKPRVNWIHPWDKMNWNLSNQVLTQIWKTGLNQVSAHRCNHHLANAAFRTMKHRVPAAWEAAVETERSIAAEWFTKKIATASVA